MPASSSSIAGSSSAMSREGVLVWRPIPSLETTGGGRKLSRRFASVSSAVANGGGRGNPNGEKVALVSPEQLLRHPLALLALVPNGVALFTAGALAGAAAKSLTAPLDRIKLLMQTHALRVGEESGRKEITFLEAFKLIGKEEGVKGYWKGNLPQIMRIIPYSAVQLFSYEVYKKVFSDKDGELSVVGRLFAGACAGMTSTFLTYPLDVLRLRLAVETGSQTMSQIALSMLREEGFSSFYGGLGPSLIGIAPYIAVNFCIFDLMKKSLPEKDRKRPESSLITAMVSASVATFMCYPLDTVRRQMQMKGSPYNTIFDAFPGILERDGFVGLYRGFLPNALKSLPNSRFLKKVCIKIRYEHEFQETRCTRIVW
ncbi:thylakoid ADP,ATP carrier protein, chloroplastic-like isoform X2 [Phalaenopsis equestris]|uniref:thylakoid ADP,ATP carrier protein, chloroplastic-like isoform X2 n=1 Tax=Phalaenopsis equestris TaxID=78828 RepID=UPI0009E4AA75|nr:thylakoid ADP,ATP carrier protein, chloroplastic-like isoform X2 [Phalaenopsis equestris]